MIWHRRSMAACIFYRRLAERDVTVTASLTAAAFPTSMSEKCKYTSSSAIKVKNQQKTVGIEEKLDVISRLEKDE